MATNNLCRLCLAADDLFWIFGEENKMVKIKNTISMLTGIQIRTCDFISQMICGKCYQFITQILQFREQCLQADKHFQDYMDHFDIKPCISSEPTIENITQARTPRCKCEQNIPHLHPTIVDVFHSYPKIKLPSKCLKLNVKPVIQMPLDLIQKALELDQCAKDDTKKLPGSIEKDETEKENMNVAAANNNTLKDDDKVTRHCKSPKIDCNKSSLQGSNTELEQSMTKNDQIYSKTDSVSKKRKHNDISKEETKTDSNNSKDDKIVAEHSKTTTSSVGASSITSFLQSCKKKVGESTTKEDRIGPSDESSCKKRKLIEKKGTISEKTSNSVKRRHTLNANGNWDHNNTLNANDKEYSEKQYNSKNVKGNKSDNCLNKSSKSISMKSNKEYTKKHNSSKEIYKSNKSRTDSLNTDYETKLKTSEQKKSSTQQSKQKEMIDEKSNDSITDYSAKNDKSILTSSEKEYNKKTSEQKKSSKQQSKQNEMIDEKSNDSIIDYSAKNDKSILTSSEKEYNKKQKHTKEIKTKSSKSDDKTPNKNRKKAKDEDSHNSTMNSIHKTVLTKSNDKETIKKSDKNQLNPKKTANERPNDYTKYSPTKNENDSYSLTNVEKSVPLYVCEICNAVHSKLFHLEKHQRKHMRCQFCKVIFRSLESKKSHIENACLKREIMMNDLPNIVLPKIEKDATITQKYPEAFLGMINPIDTSNNASMIEKPDVIEIVSDDDIPVMKKCVSPIVPDVTVSTSADLAGIDEKVLSKLKPLFRKSVHNVGSQTILPTNDDIKITEPGEAVLEKLIDQLHHYRIPVETQAGDFNVSYIYNFKAKTPKKMCLWNDITPIL